MTITGGDNVFWLYEQTNFGLEIEHSSIDCEVKGKEIQERYTLSGQNIQSIEGSDQFEVDEYHAINNTDGISFMHSSKNPDATQEGDLYFGINTLTQITGGVPDLPLGQGGIDINQYILIEIQDVEITPCTTFCLENKVGTGNCYTFTLEYYNQSYSLENGYAFLDGDIDQISDPGARYVNITDSTEFAAVHQSNNELQITLNELDNTTSTLNIDLQTEQSSVTYAESIQNPHNCWFITNKKMSEDGTTVVQFTLEFNESEDPQLNNCTDIGNAFCSGCENDILNEGNIYTYIDSMGCSQVNAEEFIESYPGQAFYNNLCDCCSGINPQTCFEVTAPEGQGWYYYDPDCRLMEDSIGQQYGVRYDTNCECIEANTCDDTTSDFGWDIIEGECVERTANDENNPAFYWTQCECWGAL